MEAPELHDALIEIDEQGTLHADASVLSRLKNQRFRLQVRDDTITLAPARPRLSQIADLAERERAYQEFVRQVALPSDASLPPDWATIRDGIYD